MKRFYKQAGSAGVEGGHGVLLDGRPVRTPARAQLVVPSAALAAAVAEEWQAQGETVEPRTMPLMRLVATALDRVAAERERVEADLVAFGASDLLCYRTDSPAELGQRQTALWQPPLDWAARTLDAPLVVTTGLVAVAQPEAAVSALARHLGRLPALELMVVHAVTVATGSLVLGLALHAGEIDAGAAFEAGLVDELYNLEVWGEDPGGRARLDALREELAQAERLLLLLRQDGTTNNWP